MSQYDLPARPRRNRRSAVIRSLVRENEVRASDLIQPAFVCEGHDREESISSMPGISRLSLDRMVKECEGLLAVGVGAIALFPAISDAKKDKLASESKNEESLLSQTVRAIKKNTPEICV